MIDFEYIGHFNNWMDFRDNLIYVLQNCDTKLKFDKTLNALILSVGGIDSIQEVRRGLGIKELSKEEIKSLKKGGLT